MPPLPAPRKEGTIAVDDGRRIGYAEYGPADGWPVLWFHGSPGSRRQVPLVGRLGADSHGTRLVLLERPGSGESDSHLYDSVLDWTVDVAICADQLDIDGFAVAGVSGGGPYALAVAQALGDRVVSAAILAGVVPRPGRDTGSGRMTPSADRAAFVLRHSYAPTGAVLRLIVQGLRPVGSPLFDLVTRLSPANERAGMQAPGTREMFIEDLVVGSRRRFDGMGADFVLFGRDWGFSVDDIEVPVHFWHGEADRTIPLAHCRELVARVPRADLRVLAGEGHYGVLSVVDEVLATLAEDHVRGG
jgi:pimeloyl-ACP methyl ester carboxylesterase